MSEQVIISCTKEYYNEYLLMLNRAFKKDIPYWFVFHMPHVLPPAAEAQPADLAKNFLTLIDGKVAGSLGVYPQDILLSHGGHRVTIKAGGVGQVACLDDYRGQGVMSGLLKHSLKFMRENDIALSWLAGDRFRYGRYGWEYAGIKTRISLEKKYLPKGNEKASIREASAADIALLNSLYEKNSSYLIRDNLRWQRHLAAPTKKFMIAESNTGTAYFAFNSQNRGNIYELQGSVPELHMLLFQHMEYYDLDSLALTVSPLSGELENSMYTHAFNSSTHFLDEFNIINVHSLFKQLKIFVELQAQDFKINLHSAWADSLSETEQLSICRKLLGFFAAPETKSRFAFLHAIQFWIPETDEI